MNRQKETTKYLDPEYKQIQETHCACTSNSYEILPRFDLEWVDLKGYSKPVADFGASYSPFSVEAYLNDVDIIPVDIAAGLTASQFVDMQAFNFTNPQLYEKYVRDPKIRELVPEVTEELPSVTQFSNAIKKISSVVNSRSIAANISRLPMVENSFSIGLVYNVVPKHSLDLDSFLNQQLPELLRVVEHKVYVYPLARHEIRYDCIVKSSEGKIVRKFLTASEVNDSGVNIFKAIYVEVDPIYRNEEMCDNIRSVARERGFEMEFITPAKPRIFLSDFHENVDNIVVFNKN